MWWIGIGFYSSSKYQRIDSWRIYSWTIGKLFANREVFAEHWSVLFVIFLRNYVNRPYDIMRKNPQINLELDTSATFCNIRHKQIIYSESLENLVARKIQCFFLLQQYVPTLTWLCYISVTEVLQRCYKSVKGGYMCGMCYSVVAGVLQWRYMDTTAILQLQKG